MGNPRRTTAWIVKPGLKWPPETPYVYQTSQFPFARYEKRFRHDAPHKPRERARCPPRTQYRLGGDLRCTKYPCSKKLHLERHKERIRTAKTGDLEDVAEHEGRCRTRARESVEESARLRVANATDAAPFSVLPNPYRRTHVRLQQCTQSTTQISGSSTPPIV